MAQSNATSTNFGVVPVALFAFAILAIPAAWLDLKGPIAHQYHSLQEFLPIAAALLGFVVGVVRRLPGTTSVGLLLELFALVLGTALAVVSVVYAMTIYYGFPIGTYRIVSYYYIPLACVAAAGALVPWAVGFRNSSCVVLAAIISIAVAFEIPNRARAEATDFITKKQIDARAFPGWWCGKAHRNGGPVCLDYFCQIASHGDDRIPTTPAPIKCSETIFGETILVDGHEQ